VTVIKSSVTVSLVEEARGGPFVLWDDLATSCRKSRVLGFDAIEIFAPSADAVDQNALQPVLDATHMKVAAVGTGAGWVVDRLSLSDPDSSRRVQAREFVRSIIEMGASFDAPAIVGSMQGRARNAVDHQTALRYLAEALDDLGQYADRVGVPLIFEPLNRYETNLINTIEQGKRLLASLSTDNVKLLADLFHMNLEEVDIAGAIRLGASDIGHVHFADSNRRPAGCGHLDFQPIAAALHAIGYEGYASAEALPDPNPDEAARLAIEGFHAVFG